MMTSPGVIVAAGTMFAIVLAVAVFLLLSGAHVFDVGMVFSNFNPLSAPNMTIGELRPNARENGQISPSTTVRATCRAGRRLHLASAFQGSRKIATIYTSSAVIRGMSV
jgi:hypothetical protein